MAQILDGNKISAIIRDEIKEEVSKMKEKPCLTVVLCSNDPASEIYVRKKQQACAEVGIESQLIKPFSEDGVTAEEVIFRMKHPQECLLSVVRSLNDDPAVDGILVQLPLPKSLSQHAVFDLIDPRKDVDVFSPTNVGLLLQGRPRFVPCTPAGIQELLTRSGIKIAGKKVAIINRSDIVGKPLSALLIQDHGEANATVVTCHDQTPPQLLKQICLSSDIIVVAVGKSNFLTADMVPEGCIVVDVGINRIGKKIVGDVDFEPVAAKASWISPVPGGVGPMTITMLLKNTLKAAKWRYR